MSKPIANMSAISAAKRAADAAALPGWLRSVLALVVGM